LAAADNGSCKLPIAQDLYPEESLAVAIEAFALYCDVEIGGATLALHMRAEHRRESRKIIGSFLSFLLDSAAHIRLRAEAER